MARSIKAITTGGTKATRTEVLGLRELEATVRDLISLDDAGMSPGQKSARAFKAQKELAGVLGEGANMLKQEIKARAEAQGWPKAVIGAIFSYADLSKDRRKRKSALAGIRKGAPPRRDMDIYREWNPGTSWGGNFNVLDRATMKRRDAVMTKGLVTGRKIGMSLAAMFEYGTSKMQARPAFRPAVKAVQQAVIRKMAEGYKSVIEKLARAA